MPIFLIYVIRSRKWMLANPFLIPVFTLRVKMTIGQDDGAPPTQRVLVSRQSNHVIDSVDREGLPQWPHLIHHLRGKKKGRMSSPASLIQPSLSIGGLKLTVTSVPLSHIMTYPIDLLTSVSAFGAMGKNWLLVIS